MTSYRRFFEPLMSMVLATILCFAGILLMLSARNAYEASLRDKSGLLSARANAASISRILRQNDFDGGVFFNQNENAVGIKTADGDFEWISAPNMEVTAGGNYVTYVINYSDGHGERSISTTVYLRTGVTFYED